MAAPAPDRVQGIPHAPGRLAPNTLAATPRRLLALGWSTPQALQLMQRVPLDQDGYCSGHKACYKGWNGIAFDASFWTSATWTPMFAVLILAHEYNHFFDEYYAQVSSNLEFQRLSAQANSFLGFRNADPVERYALLGQYPFLFPELRPFYRQFSDRAYDIHQSWWLRDPLNPARGQ